MIVMKFGGTSLATPDEVRAVAAIVRERLPDRPAVVVSAHAGVTDLLDELAFTALERPTGIEEIRSRHAELVRGLGLAEVAQHPEPALEKQGQTIGLVLDAIQHARGEIEFQLHSLAVELGHLAPAQQSTAG